MFQCEHPDVEYEYIRYTDEPLKLKIVQDVGMFGDAPDSIQLNWENTVLWRGTLRYPK